MVLRKLIGETASTATLIPTLVVEKITSNMIKKPRKTEII